MVVTTRGNDEANMDALRASIDELGNRMHDMEDRITERMNGMLKQQQVIHEGFQRMGNHAKVGNNGILTGLTNRVEDPLSELKSLRQTGSVQEYHDEFESLLTKVDVNEKRAINLFVSGLQKEIELSVSMFKPRTLKDSFCLAKLHEDMLAISKKKYTELLPSPEGSTSRSTPQNAMLTEFLEAGVIQPRRNPFSLTNITVLEPMGVEEHKDNRKTEGIMVTSEDTQPRPQINVNQELNTFDKVKLDHIEGDGNPFEDFEKAGVEDFEDERGLDSVLDEQWRTIQVDPNICGDVEVVELFNGDENDNVQEGTIHDELIVSADVEMIALIDGDEMDNNFHLVAMIRGGISVGVGFYAPFAKSCHATYGHNYQVQDGNIGWVIDFRVVQFTASDPKTVNFDI